MQKSMKHCAELVLEEGRDVRASLQALELLVPEDTREELPSDRRDMV